MFGLAGVEGVKILFWNRVGHNIVSTIHATLDF